MKKYIKDENGATAIEYGLIAAGIAVAISIIVSLAGDSIYNKLFGREMYINAIISECESTIPRNQHCKLIAVIDMELTKENGRVFASPKVSK